MKKMNPGMMAIMAKKKPVKMNGGGKMPMVMKNGEKVPAFAADGEGWLRPVVCTGLLGAFFRVEGRW